MATATADKPRAKPAKSAKSTKATKKAAAPKVSAEDKAKAAAERTQKSKLAVVGRKGVRYSKVRTDVLDIRDGLDAAILDARKAGASYKDIAAEAKVSVSWVQTSLGRSGYQPVGRVRSGNVASNGA